MARAKKTQPEGDVSFRRAFENRTGAVSKAIQSLVRHGRIHSDKMTKENVEKAHRFLTLQLDHAKAELLSIAGVAGANRSGFSLDMDLPQASASSPVVVNNVTGASPAAPVAPVNLNLKPNTVLPDGRVVGANGQIEGRLVGGSGVSASVAAAVDDDADFISDDD